MKKCAYAIILLFLLTISIYKQPPMVHICIDTDEKPYKCLVQRLSRKHNVDTKLIRAMIFVESSFNPQAKSKSGAYGLMQLMPLTAKAYGVDRYNIEQNVEGGILHFKKMYDRFGSVELALAAYNAGEGTVAKYASIPPYPETRQYVSKVLKYSKKGEL